MISSNHMKKLGIFLSAAFLLIALIKILEIKGIITWEFKIPTQVQEKITPSNISTSTAKLYFLDIGQGDATLIVFPNQEEMLIDCAKDAIVLSALSRVRHWHDRTIDYLLVSHPDADHYAGCIDVLERYDVKKIVLTGYQKNNGQLWNTFLEKVEAAKAKGTIVEYVTAPEKWQISGIDVDFLYPVHNVAIDPRVPHTNSIESNDTSLIIKISAGNKDVLLTADAELPLETYLAKIYREKLQAEVLKVGHHGSLTSSGEEFLNSVQPEYCVISAGKNNSYGHPALRVVKRLERYQCQILRTDQVGDILFSLSAESVKYENPPKLN